MTILSFTTFYFYTTDDRSKISQKAPKCQNSEMSLLFGITMTNAFRKLCLVSNMLYIDLSFEKIL